MRNSEQTTCVVARAGSGNRFMVWTATAGDAELLAEALYEARPRWEVTIDGKEAVFSRDGKVVGFI
jgi:hypothetical protein